MSSPTKEHHGRRVLRLPAVEGKTGLKKSQILAAAAEGRFPRPFPILENGRAMGWDEQEIDEYLESRLSARDAGERPEQPPQLAQATRERVEAARKRGRA